MCVCAVGKREKEQEFRSFFALSSQVFCGGFSSSDYHLACFTPFFSSEQFSKSSRCCKVRQRRSEDEPRATANIVPDESTGGLAREGKSSVFFGRISIRLSSFFLAFDEEKLLVFV